MTDDSGGEWLTIAEAAALLGVRPVAIRSRIQRKALRVRPADRENDGRTRVWIAHTAGADTGNTTAPMTDAGSDAITGHTALLTEMAALRERLGRSESAEAELRARLADHAGERDRLITDRDRLETELAAERRHARDMAGRLDQAHRDRLADAERQRAELDALRAELAIRWSWWRRWFQR